MSPIKSFINNFKDYIKERPQNSPPQHPKLPDSESSNVAKMLETLQKNRSISANSISSKNSSKNQFISSSVTLSSKEITQSKILDLVSMAKHAKLHQKTEDKNLKQIAKYIAKHLPHNEKIDYKWIKLTLRYMFRQGQILTKEKEHFLELIQSDQSPNKNTISILNKIIKTAKTHKKIEQHALKKIARYIFKHLPEQDKTIDYKELKVVLTQLNCNEKLSIEEKVHVIQLVSHDSEKPNPNDRIIQRLFAKVTKAVTLKRNIEDEKLKQIAKLLLKHIPKEENINFKQVRATLIEMEASNKLTVQEKQHLLSIIKKKKKIDHVAVTIFSKIIEEPQIILKRVTERANTIKEAPEVIGEKGEKVKLSKEFVYDRDYLIEIENCQQNKILDVAGLLEIENHMKMDATPEGNLALTFLNVVKNHFSRKDFLKLKTELYNYFKKEALEASQPTVPSVKSQKRVPLLKALTAIKTKKNLIVDATLLPRKLHRKIYLAKFDYLKEKLEALNNHSILLNSKEAESLEKLKTLAAINDVIKILMSSGKKELGKRALLISAQAKKYKRQLHRLCLHEIALLHEKMIGGLDKKIQLLKKDDEILNDKFLEKNIDKLEFKALCDKLAKLTQTDDEEILAKLNQLKKIASITE